jgi:hypothetical protein
VVTVTTVCQLASGDEYERLRSALVQRLTILALIMSGNGAGREFDKEHVYASNLIQNDFRTGGPGR